MYVVSWFKKFGAVAGGRLVQTGGAGVRRLAKNNNTDGPIVAPVKLHFRDECEFYAAIGIR